ncbi:MAG TPA: tetratricopeptide repeat protein, partial [Candidatus Methylomirabilis sp.]|nr:tetratricopeptide repeat protein [Candidatus Methylomirabilis sp.]
SRPEAHFHLGRILLHVKDTDGAVASLRRAADGGLVAAKALLSSVIEDRGDRDGAAKLRDEIKASGAGPQAEAWLEAHHAAEERRWKEAVDLDEMLIDMDKAGHEVYPGSAAEIHVSCGLAYFQLGEYSRARGHFQMGGALRRGAVEPELFEACTWYAEGNPKRAEEIFESLFRRRPSDDVAAWVTQIYWVRFRDPERALVWAERQGPGWLREFWRAACLTSLGRNAEAIEVAKRLPDLNPDAALSHFMAAVALLSAGEYDRAAEHAARAVEGAPRSAAPREVLAGACAALGKSEEARKLLLEAIELEPGIASARFYLGLTLWGLGRLDEASEALRESIEIGSRAPGS